MDVHVNALAVFRLPEGVTLEDNAGDIRMSAVSVAYGTLRGFLMSATSPFPGGVLVLPAIAVSELAGTNAAGSNAAELGEKRSEVKLLRRHRGDSQLPPPAGGPRRSTPTRKAAKKAAPRRKVARKKAAKRAAKKKTALKRKATRAK